MRGSPLLRTAIVLLVLLLGGIGLSTLGQRRLPTAPRPETPPSEGAVITAPFILTLSASAERVALESAGTTQEFARPERTITGLLGFEKDNPLIFLDVEWQEPTPQPRFAKLVLEPTGLSTQTHTFDASGPLSDVWEFQLDD